MFSLNYTKMQCMFFGTYGSCRTKKSPGGNH